MNLIDLEKKCKIIIELREKRNKIQQEINKNVKEVLTIMNNEKKKNMKVGKYSLEIKKMIRRRFDFDLLDNLQKKGIIPENAMKKEEYERLLITTSKKIKLVDGKFVFE